MWLTIAQYLGYGSVVLFAAMTFCTFMGGQIGNTVVNLGVTILYFGLYVLVIGMKLY
jgi:hypothetical protein